MKKRISDDLVALRFNNNYDDEFNVEGVLIVERTWWENHKKDALSLFGPHTREGSFGTNEAVVFDNADDYLNSFSEINASQDEIMTLKKLIGDQVGIVSLLEFDEDEDGEDEEWSEEEEKEYNGN